MKASSFITEQFRKEGMYLLYGPNKQFVARFKHKGPVSMAKFQKELITNHSVEDYFFDLNTARKTFLEILKEKNPQWYNQIKEQWLAKA